MLLVKRVVCGIVAVLVMLLGVYLINTDIAFLQALGFCLDVVGVALGYIAIIQRMPNYNFWVTLVALGLAVALFIPKESIYEEPVEEKEVIAKPKEEKIEKKKTDLEEKKKKSMSRLAQYPKITGSIEVIHANVFYINGRYVRLFGVDAPDNDQICSDAKGMSYNCGREAASWVVGWIDNNPIDCYLLQVNPNGVNVATCVWGEYDIGAGLVGAGWAIANTNETNIYAPYEAKAQANSYGLWAGTFYSPQDWRDIKSEQNNFVIKSKPKASGWFKSLF